MPGVWRVTIIPQMMLGNDFYRIVICKYGNIGMGFYRFYQASLYFSSCIVFVVQDAELGMSSFLCGGRILHLLFLSKSTPHFISSWICAGASRTTFFYSRAVTDPIAGNHRVFNVFLEIVYFQVGNRCYTSLSKIGIGFFQSCFTNQATLPLWATFSAKLIPASPEPITRKSNFLTMIICFMGAKLRKTFIHCTFYSCFYYFFSWRINEIDNASMKLKV